MRGWGYCTYESKRKGVGVSWGAVLFVWVSNNRWRVPICSNPGGGVRVGSAGRAVAGKGGGVGGVVRTKKKPA